MSLKHAMLHVVHCRIEWAGVSTAPRHGSTSVLAGVAEARRQGTHEEMDARILVICSWLIAPSTSGFFGFAVLSTVTPEHRGQ